MSLLDYFPDARPATGGHMARCPAHKDRKASLSINPGHSVAWVLHCFAGCEPPDIADAAGVPWSVVSGPREDKPADDNWMPCVARHGHTWQTTYVYRNRRGAVALGVSRCTSKCFAQWRPDATSKSGRKWSITLPDGSKAGAGIPYRLERILALRPDDIVYVVEGEKDADRLWDECGIVGTCNAGGAGKWTPEHAVWLAGQNVIVVADRDKPGMQHALAVTETLMTVAASISIAQATNGKDLSDHLNAGGSLDGMIAVAHPKLPEGILWAT